MRLPFFRARKGRGSTGGEASEAGPRESPADSAAPVDKGASPLPRRRPGSHILASKIVKVDPAAADPVSRDRHLGPVGCP